MEDTSHICEPILAEITSPPATTSSTQLPLEFFEDPFTSGINKFPEEILIKIITPLPLKDRKSTRLVCKRWSDVSNIRQISTKEELVCYRCGYVDLFLQTVANCERRILNLEFIEVDFRVQHDQDRSFKFWEAVGYKIESLSFVRCHFSDKTLSYVIEYCTKMQNLTVRSSLEPSKQKYLSSTAVERLKEMNLRQEHLKSLTFGSLKPNSLGNFLKLMVDIYPNLDNFRFVYGKLTREEMADLVRDEETFDKNYQKLKNLKQENGSWWTLTSDIEFGKMTIVTEKGRSRFP